MERWNALSFPVCNPYFWCILESIRFIHAHCSTLQGSTCSILLLNHSVLMSTIPLYLLENEQQLIEIFLVAISVNFNCGTMVFIIWFSIFTKTHLGFQSGIRNAEFQQGWHYSGASLQGRMENQQSQNIENTLREEIKD